MLKNRVASDESGNWRYYKNEAYYDDQAGEKNKWHRWFKMAQPLPKSFDLIKKINALVSVNPTDEFSVKRLNVSLDKINDEIDALEKVDYGAARYCKMMACSIKKDISGMVKNQKIAIQYGYDSAFDYLNYAATFSNVGLSLSALECIRTSCNLGKSPDSLKWAYELARNAGCFQESLTYWQELIKMNAVNIEESNNAAQLVEFMQANHLTDDDVSQFIKIAEDVALRNDTKIKSSTSYVYKDAFDEFISVDLELNADAQKTSYLMAQLADEIVASIPDASLFSKVLCGFVSQQGLM
jgi:hypothetical protein